MFKNIGQGKVLDRATGKKGLNHLAYTNVGSRAVFVWDSDQAHVEPVA